MFPFYPNVHAHIYVIYNSLDKCIGANGTRWYFLSLSLCYICYSRQPGGDDGGIEANEKASNKAKHIVVNEKPTDEKKKEDIYCLYYENTLI